MWRLRIGNSVIGAWVLALLAVGCFDDIDARECRTLADCGPGFARCEDGYCFKRASGCAGGTPVAGDSCCSQEETDRAGDVDCLVADLDLRGATPVTPEAKYAVRSLTCPVVLPDGAVIVSGAVVDGTGTSRVMVWRTDPALREVVASAHAGDGWTAWPVVVGGDFSAYVAHDDGVARLSTAALEPEDDVLSGTPAGGLVAVADEDRKLIVWATTSGTVEIYDEQSRFSLSVKLRPEDGGGEAWPPVASVSGRRALVVFKWGLVLAIETRISPLGPAATGCVDGALVPASPGKPPSCQGDLPSGPPVEWGGVVFVPVGEGRVVALVEKDRAMVGRWSIDLGGPIAGRLLVDRLGRVVAVLQDGRVRIVKDQGDFGSIVELASFGGPVLDLAPALGAADRIVAFGAGGSEVVSLLRREAAGEVSFTPGVRFDLPVPPATAPAFGDRVLLYGSSAGRLTAWTYPDTLATVGFPKDGGDPSGSGRGRAP